MRDAFTWYRSIVFVLFWSAPLRTMDRFGYVALAGVRESRVLEVSQFPELYLKGPRRHGHARRAMLVAPRLAFFFFVA